MQALDPAGNYGDAEVVDVLAFRHGARTISYRYDRLDELNTFVESLDAVLDGSVSNNALADIKRTAKFTLLDDGGINYLRDRIQPWARLGMPDGGYVEWPLGVFLLATPERVLSPEGVVTREVEAYDQLLILEQDRLADRYSIAAGTVYTAAIATFVFGIPAAIVPSTLTLPAAMEWEPGTTRLRVLNDLLSAINYDSAWFNERGVLVCQPYQSPAVRSPEYEYATDEASVIRGDVTQTLDLFDVPNRFVLVKSEADQAPLTSIYTNTSDSSPTSTVSRGRTITDFRTDDAANQATLDAKAARLAFEASQIFENVKVTTAAMPMHSNADVLTLNIPELAVGAKFSEHSWDLPLRVGASMTHTMRRVVTV